MDICINAGPRTVTVNEKKTHRQIVRTNVVNVIFVIC